MNKEQSITSVHSKHPENNQYIYIKKQTTKQNIHC